MRKHILLGVSAVVILATGCASMDDTQRRTATGAGVGALAGAVIGSATGGNGSAGLPERSENTPITKGNCTVFSEP